MPAEDRIAQIKMCVADAVREMGEAIELIETDLESGGPGANYWQLAQESLDAAAEHMRQAVLSCVFAVAEASGAVEGTTDNGPRTTDREEANA